MESAKGATKGATTGWVVLKQDGAISWLKLARSVIPATMQKGDDTPGESADNQTGEHESNDYSNQEFTGVDVALSSSPTDPNTTTTTNDNYLQQIEQSLRAIHNRDRRPSDTESLKRVKSMLSEFEHALHRISEDPETEIIGGVNVRDLEEEEDMTLVLILSWKLTMKLLRTNPKARNP